MAMPIQIQDRPKELKDRPESSLDLHPSSKIPDITTDTSSNPTHNSKHIQDPSQYCPQHSGGWSHVLPCDYSIGIQSFGQSHPCMTVAALSLYY